MRESKWIWYYGDFELYHSLKTQTLRDEYDYQFPPFWRMDDCWHNVKFRKTVSVNEGEKLIVYAQGIGRIEVGGKRFPFNREITLTQGTHTIEIYVANTTGLPCIYIDSETIISDESWEVSSYGGDWINAGCNDFYTDKNDNPQIFKLSHKEIMPSVTISDNGILYDYGKETFAKLVFENVNTNIRMFFGESREEAFDAENCYLRSDINNETKEFSARAFRYIYIPNADENSVSFKAYYEYLPLEMRGKFYCSDELINKIWDISAYTLQLNSREFFFEGLKRDRWIWSGDAYQSYFVNRYLFFDKDIAKRTILALRGRNLVEKHINTILDYSFYWIMSIYDYYEMTADAEFLIKIYPKMKSLMDFCLSRLDENGFASKYDEDDWIYIDWASIDKTGAVCAEQLLLVRSLEVMSECAKVIDKDGKGYQTMSQELLKKINQFYWNEEKGAYIDSFESGKNNVTRHANIFALLFGYADEHQRKSIIQNVIMNDDIPQIKTPYFKFYELSAMCHIGELDYALDSIRSYWGGMLDEGATSFWEEYNPEVTGIIRYKMYGDKFGKSLCHAWGASPIYLIGRYFLGVKPTSAGYKSFEVRPQLDKFDEIDATVPICGGSVFIVKKDGVISVSSDCEGGTLIHNSNKYILVKDNVITIR